MSVQNDAIQQILLNEMQVNAIIDYAVAHKLYDGTPPTDPEAKRTDAATLVYQARRSQANGSNHPDVKEICFIAEVDQNPQASTDGQVLEVPAQLSLVDPAAGFAPVAPAPEGELASQDGELDLTKASPEQLTQMIEGLLPHQSLPPVAAEIAKVRAEQERRAGAAQVAAQVVQPPQTQVPPPTPTGAQPPPAPALPPQPPGDAVPPPPTGGVLPPGATDASGQLRPVADAQTPPAVQAPQPEGEGEPPQAQPDAQAGRRAELLGKLNGAILAVYGKTFDDVAQISDADLERMLAFPGGPVAVETTATVPPPGPPDRVSVSPEREALENQITGPILKAWGRGRVDIIGLTDDQLRHMIANPNGPAPEVSAQSPLGIQAQPTSTTGAQSTTVFVPAPVSEPYPLPTAEQIIAREHFPIAPEVESPPNLPFDISKLSDDDLRSVHAQFHAVLCRANWVIAEHREQIADQELLLAAREVEVKNEPREGKTTKDQMTAIVAGDPKVQELTLRIAEMKKPLNKLEVIADNARSTCSRCSRDWSMRWKEDESVAR